MPLLQQLFRGQWEPLPSAIFLQPLESRKASHRGADSFADLASAAFQPPVAICSGGWRRRVLSAFLDHGTEPPAACPESRRVGNLGKRSSASYSTTSFLSEERGQEPAIPSSSSTSKLRAKRHWTDTAFTEMQDAERHGHRRAHGLGQARGTGRRSMAASFADADDESLGIGLRQKPSPAALASRHARRRLRAQTTCFEEEEVPDAVAGFMPKNKKGGEDGDSKPETNYACMCPKHGHCVYGDICPKGEHIDSQACTPNDRTVIFPPGGKKFKECESDRHSCACDDSSGPSSDSSCAQICPMECAAESDFAQTIKLKQDGRAIIVDQMKPRKGEWDKGKPNMSKEWAYAAGVRPGSELIEVDGDLKNWKNDHGTQINDELNWWFPHIMRFRGPAPDKDLRPICEMFKGEEAKLGPLLQEFGPHGCLPANTCRKGALCCSMGANKDGGDENFEMECHTNEVCKGSGVCKKTPYPLPPEEEGDEVGEKPTPEAEENAEEAKVKQDNEAEDHGFPAPGLQPHKSENEGPGQSDGMGHGDEGEGHGHGEEGGEEDAGYGEGEEGEGHGEDGGGPPRPALLGPPPIDSAPPPPPPPPPDPNETIFLTQGRTYTFDQFQELQGTKLDGKPVLPPPILKIFFTQLKAVVEAKVATLPKVKATCGTYTCSDVTMTKKEGVDAILRPDDDKCCEMASPQEPEDPRDMKKPIKDEFAEDADVCGYRLEDMKWKKVKGWGEDTGDDDQELDLDAAAKNASPLGPPPEDGEDPAGAPSAEQSAGEPAPKPPDEYSPPQDPELPKGTTNDRDLEKDIFKL